MALVSWSSSKARRRSALSTAGTAFSAPATISARWRSSTSRAAARTSRPAPPWSRRLSRSGSSGSFSAATPRSRTASFRRSAGGCARLKRPERKARGPGMAVARVVCPAFIGRESELSVLEDSLLSAIRGEGGVVVLGGEAGMGKSRLVRELANRAERLGCVVMSGACSDAELSLPYLPFLEAIGNYLTRQDVTAMRERLGPAAAELGQLFPQMGHPGSVTADPMMSKLRLFEALVLLLTDAARSRGLLAV